MKLLNRFRKNFDSFAQKQKDLWNQMQKDGYFEKYPSYRRWVSSFGNALPSLNEDVPGQKEMPELLSGIDFGATEIVFATRGDAGPLIYFNEEIDPALKLAEEIWLPKMVDLDPGMIVLDIGCGFGRTEEWMMRRVKEVYGVDISDYIIDVCKKRFSGKRNVHFCVNSGYDLSLFEDSKFDFIYCFNVLQHIPRRFTEKYLGEIKRTLKPGGLTLFNMLSGINEKLDGGPQDINLSIGYSGENTEKLLVRAGLTSVKTYLWRLKNDDSFWIWKLARR
jgi:2-polyprenyl-3-methyl-5-hydroxy-6-metoxy-1,4-benzoquinol methylase